MKKFISVCLLAVIGVCTCFAQTSYSSVRPVLLDAPDFNGMCLKRSNIKVALKQLTKVQNGIIDTDEWLEKHIPEIFENRYTFTPGGNRATDKLNSIVPLTFEGKYRRSIELRDGYNVIYYGDRMNGDQDFGVDPTLVVITAPEVSDILYAYDFSNFSVAKYTKPRERDFTEISVSDVKIEDNVLYACVSHPTYSSSSYGYNAYLVAVDLKSQKIKWVTKPLTCNANFCIDGDVIFTGYGFTNEDDYIYMIDKASGSRLNALKIAKGPDFFTVKDGILYVRTYSLDYTFQIIR